MIDRSCNKTDYNGQYVKKLGLPIEAWRNFDPILESRPTARATSDTSAPVASQTADSEFMLDILCASIALAAYKNYCK